MSSKARFIVVRPVTFPDLTIERIWPRAVASLKRTGSRTVAVNLSPARDSLLESVSLIRTFRLVPTGTNLGVATRGAARRRRGFRVCPLTRIGNVSTTSIPIKKFFVVLDFIRFLLMSWLSKRQRGRVQLLLRRQCNASHFICLRNRWMLFALERPLPMHSAVRFEDVSGRRLAHDDILQTHQSVKQRFRPRRAAGNVNVDRNRPINPLHCRVRIKWSARRCARAHCNHPFRFRHLIVNATNDRSHFQSHSSGNDYQIALSRAGTKYAGAEAIDIETSRAGRDHLNRATGETERHRPDGRLARPVDHWRAHVDCLRADGATHIIRDRINRSQDKSFVVLSHKSLPISDRQLPICQGSSSLVSLKFA